MTPISRKYSFRKTEAGLIPTSPRSLSDLKDQSLYQSAAKLAQDIQQQGQELDTFIRSLDEKPQDTNHDFPGHVTIQDVDFKGLRLSNAGTVAASHHPRELDGTQGTLTKKRTLWFDEKTNLRVEGSGGVSKTLNPGSRKEIRQSVRQYDDYAILTVSGEPGRPELLTAECADFELPVRTDISEYDWFSLSDSRTFDELEPWHNRDTSRITDPKKAEDRAAARTANNAVKEVLGVNKQAMSLDQTPHDLNDRPGEVLLQGAQLGDRVISGSIRPMYTRGGKTAEAPSGSTYSKPDHKPFMEMRSEATGETFIATFGQIREFEGSYSDRCAQEIFTYSNPEQTVKARVGEHRTWYLNREPGWHPHREDDREYPKGSNFRGGSVEISKGA